MNNMFHAVSWCRQCIYQSMNLKYIMLIINRWYLILYQQQWMIQSMQRQMMRCIHVTDWRCNLHYFAIQISGYIFHFVRFFSFSNVSWAHYSFGVENFEHYSVQCKHDEFTQLTFSITNYSAKMRASTTKICTDVE